VRAKLNFRNLASGLTMLRLSLAAAMCLLSQAHAGGPWGAGWGFAAHGGVPAQPPILQSFALNRSVALALLGNVSAIFKSFLGKRSTISFGR
jgi:hypothetical protein